MNLSMETWKGEIPRRERFTGASNVRWARVIARVILPARVVVRALVALNFSLLVQRKVTVVDASLALHVLRVRVVQVAGVFALVQLASVLWRTVARSFAK